MLRNTSIQVFRLYIDKHPDTGELDATRVVSRECYLEWINTRFTQEYNDESTKFWRALTNHLSGTDGRCPFKIEEEAAILAVLRRRERWPCFPSHLAHLGTRYRSRGFHEKHIEYALNKQAAAAETQEEVTTANDVQDLLRLLCRDDAIFLSNLAMTIVHNYYSSTTNDLVSVAEILRYTILARTPRVQKSAPWHIAQQLCDLYTLRMPNADVIVCDITAKYDEQRLLAQNAKSMQDFGMLIGSVNTCGALMRMDRTDMLRLLIAIGGAYHKPGEEFTVKQQRIMRRNDPTAKPSLFDMTYVVDMNSFFLVVFATLQA